MMDIEADWTGAHLISAKQAPTEDSVYRAGQSDRARAKEEAKAVRQKVVRKLHGQNMTAKQIGRELAVACSTIYKDLAFLGLPTHNSRDNKG